MYRRTNATGTNATRPPRTRPPRPTPPRAPFACLEGAMPPSASTWTCASRRSKRTRRAGGATSAPRRASAKFVSRAAGVATAPGEAYESGDAREKFARNASARGEGFFFPVVRGGGDDDGAPLLLRGHARKEDEGRGGFGRGGSRASACTPRFSRRCAATRRRRSPSPLMSPLCIDLERFKKSI